VVSVIIPVLNEEKSIENTLKSALKLQGEKEIIVVDGGSTDDTIQIAERYARVIKSPKGRAYQMNAGAREAKGDILWFVHSDSVLDVASIVHIEDAIRNGATGGGFSLYFYDYDIPFMKYISITSNWRARYMGLYFGDQGLFVRKDIFFKLNGFPEIELMEDFEMSRKLVKEGSMKLLPIKIGTSARRFKQGGPLKTHLKMHKIKLLYIFGTSPSKLNKIYREVR
jgi:rSAM/selenodomain-associated transferase 2